MKALITLLICVQAIDSFCCICREDSLQNVREASIGYAEIIFTGKVIQEDTINGTYTIEVLTNFKGDVQGKLIASSMLDSVTFSYCSFWPSRFWGDEFIIYAKYVEGTEFIHIADCLATRSISNPHIHLSYIYLETLYYDQGLRIDENEIKRIALEDLNEELELLGNLKYR